MGILVKGLKMPQGEEMLCINIYPDGKVCVSLDLKCKRIATAVSIPPHGDLLDKDELSSLVGESFEYFLARLDLRCPKAVVTAEKSKDE